MRFGGLCGRLRSSGGRSAREADPAGEGRGGCVMARWDVAVLIDDTGRRWGAGVRESPMARDGCRPHAHLYLLYSKRAVAKAVPCVCGQRVLDEIDCPTCRAPWRRVTGKCQ